MFGLSEILAMNQRAAEQAKPRLFLFRHHREPSFLGRIPLAWSILPRSGVFARSRWVLRSVLCRPLKPLAR